jgi:thioredoxin reductase (NADPH)
MSLAVIVVVVDEPDLLTRLSDDLRRRFGTDYEIVAGSSEWALNGLDLLADQGRDVALVMAPAELPDVGMSGVALLTNVRARHPQARRLLLVERGRWRGHPVREAMVLGQVDSYVFVPWALREQWLYLPVTEALVDWSKTRPPEAVAVSVVGRDSDRRFHELRDIFSRASLPFAFLEPESPEAQAVLSASGVSGAALPVVVMHHGSRAVLVQPTDRDIVAALGFGSVPDGGRYDVAIIGAGPSGLSAAVYATSEGLSTVVVDPSVPGGQAGTSSMIRNYLGFPRGLAGSELTTRAIEQAWLFGTEMVLAERVGRISADGDDRVLETDFGRLVAKAVVIATGVDWRRLEAPGLDSLLGTGVFYGAALSEAEAMTGRRVVVVGGGNSAGQAAIYLARRAATVTVVVRGQSLEESMSAYLIQEIDAAANIDVLPGTEVVAGVGRGHLEGLTLRDNGTQQTNTVAADALFVMIGAQPRTDWLDQTVARDPRGYVLTGPDIPPEIWPLPRPPAFLETSLPGVFAVGDVQHDSTKRVATSVGAGAMAIRLIHNYLADLPMGE